MKKYMLLFTVCLTFYFTKNFGMETSANNDIASFFPNANNELYGCNDLSGLRITGNNLQNSYTYFTPGLVEKNVGLFLSHIVQKEENKYKFPLCTMMANGVVNRANGQKHSFNFDLEVTRQMQLLHYLNNKNLPVECWYTACYGFFPLAGTLFTLKSGCRKAIERRGRCFISDSEAAYLARKIKLIIVSNPLCNAEKMLNVSFNPIIEKSIIISTAVSAAMSTKQIIQNNNIAPFAIVMPFIGLFRKAIASRLSYYGLQYKTSIDEQRGDGLQLLYDLSHKEKRHIDSTLLVCWQREDNTVDTMYPEELSILNNTFSTFYGIGSPYNDHLNDDTRQIRVMNYVRSLHGMPHYIEPEKLLTNGKKHFEEILPFHTEQDWQGLKEYTEDSANYIL